MRQLISEFFKLKRQRIVAWLGVMLLVGAFVLFSIPPHPGGQFSEIIKIAIFMALLSFGLSSIAAATYIPRLKHRSCIWEGIVVSVLSIVLGATLAPFLGIDEMLIIENLSLALLFPLNTAISCFLKGGAKPSNT